MQKMPKQIARSLRAFRNAHRLGLLRCVRILPGGHPCDAVTAQEGTEYQGNDVPHLPLAQCTRDACECKYSPAGTAKLRLLRARSPEREARRH